MKIKDCIRFACESLLFNELADGLSDGAATEYSDQAGRELSALLSCAAAVLRELAAEHAQILMTEKIETADGLIAYADLSGAAIEIKEIRTRGRAAAFRRVYGGADTGRGGEFEVLYAVLPIIAAITDTVCFDNPRIDERIVGMGIAAEYCIREGMTEEAVLWDSRYKDALLTAKGKKRREQKVKARRWI